MMDLQEEEEELEEYQSTTKETEEREGQGGGQSAGGLGGEVEKVQVSRFRWSSGTGTVNRAANQKADPCRLQHAPACNVLRECPALSSAGSFSCDRPTQCHHHSSWSAYACCTEMRYGSSRREAAAVHHQHRRPYPH
jgi:hypothetical protein